MIILDPLLSREKSGRGKIGKDPESRLSYEKSEALLKRAEKVIPGGSQTFSKGYLNWSRGGGPLFLSHGKGSHVWDVDGNGYVDFVNGLAPIILGYCDPDVDGAVESQMKRGVLMSLSTELEVELAELLQEVIPCAEMARFAKNGSDVTAGAIRLARAFTGREHVAVCGYHGWQDWFIACTNWSLGIPESVKSLTHSFEYNNSSTLKKLLEARPGDFAAVILEPIHSTDPVPGFLETVRELTHDHGALLIFDEVISGFRHHLGGSQSLFGVLPDLAAFGKAMANGYPIAALVGRQDIMRKLEQVFFSFTNGGETLSLAAALATIRKMQAEPVLDHIDKQGQKLIEGVRKAIQDNNLEGSFDIVGRPCLSRIQYRNTPDNIDPWALRTLLRQEVLACGVLTTGTHHLSFSHSDEDVLQAVSAYSHVFRVVNEAFAEGDVEKRLRGDKVQEILKVATR